MANKHMKKFSNSLVIRKYTKLKSHELLLDTHQNANSLMGNSRREMKIETWEERGSAAPVAGGDPVPLSW